MITLPSRTNVASGVRVIDPTGASSVRNVAVLPSSAVLDPGALTIPGVTVVKGTDNTDITAVVANSPPEESIADFLKPELLQELLNKRLAEQNRVTILDPQSRLSESVARERTGTELWRLFVVLAVAFAVAEMIIARRTVVATT